MKNNRKIKSIICAALSFSLLATGCSSDKSEGSSSASGTEISQLTSETPSASDQSGSTDSTPLSLNSELISDTSALFSDRDLSPDYGSFTAEITLNGDFAEISGTGASCQGAVITITDEGVYRIGGVLTNGRIIVNSQAKVQLVLDNADITCEYSAPIYVVNADKAFVTLAEGSVNKLTDGSEYTYENEGDNEPDAVIFSHDSITVNGLGTLDISANFNEGITSKDDIVITGGTVNITSVGNGIKGKNYVAVCNAELNITSQEDGLKSTNTEEAGRGFVYAESGTFNITAAEDAIQAETEFISKGGTFNIASGGGSSQAEPHQSNDFAGRGGFFGQNGSSDAASEEDTTVSKKGIKGGTAVHISGGSYNINSADDTLHSNGFVYISGGDLLLESGDDGINADSHIEITGGNVVVSSSYEGVEAAVIGITDGTVDVTASDDGFNASDGSAQGGMGTYSDGVQLFICGGTVKVDSDGDGLDSNGDMLISAGTILVSGPTNSGNGALDGNGEIVCTGGVLAAAGSSGMAEFPGNSSTQHSVSVTFEQTHDAGTVVTLCGSGGKELISFAPKKTFNHIVLSSPDIKSGETYTVTANGSEAGSFTAEQTTSFIGSQGNMMGGGFGGNFGGGGFGGGRGDRGDMELPTNENGEPEMPQGGGFGGGKGDFEIPTGENGEPEIPEGGGFGGGGMREPPAGGNGRPEMPQGGFNPFSNHSTANIY